MPRKPKIHTFQAIQGYQAISGWEEVSRETRRARNRSEYGSRINTMANRRWGGSAITTGFRPEEAAGAARISPSTTRIKTRDDHGIALPAQHMTATRKRDERDGTAPKSGKVKTTGRKHDGAWTRLASEQEHIRNRVRDQHAQRDIQDIH